MYRARHSSVITRLYAGKACVANLLKGLQCNLLTFVHLKLCVLVVYMCIVNLLSLAVDSHQTCLSGSTLSA